MAQHARQYLDTLAPAKASIAQEVRRAIHTLLPAGKTYTTLELKVNYVKALTQDVPLVRAIGEIIYSGGRIGTSQGKLVGPDGKLYAHATTTCIVLDAR